MVEVLSIRPSEDLEKKLKLLSKMEDLSRPSLARKLLAVGAKEELKNKALELYKAKKVSLGKAAEIAGIPVFEMHNILNTNEIPLNISKKSVLSDFKRALELKM
ncbi:MAG: UPF0175 family protein [Candidatus Diapherotrites archaeon]|nr:UPF0175 family protein [Candidatus Diapherotrites archaeon]